MSDVVVVVSGGDSKTNSFACASSASPSSSATAASERRHLLNHRKSCYPRQNQLSAADAGVVPDRSERRRSADPGDGFGSRRPSAPPPFYASSLNDASVRSTASTDHVDLGPRASVIQSTSSSSAALLSKKTSGYSLKQSWRLKYQDFLPTKSEPFQRLVDRANEWLQKTPEAQVRSCETVTWSSHDSKCHTDGEQMLLTQSIDENGHTYNVRGLRLWLVPSLGRRPETLYYSDFVPTATNDIKSLVVKVNRKMAQNQMRGEIIRVETFTVPQVKGQLDSSVTRWTENSADDKLYVFSLRVFTSRVEHRVAPVYGSLRPVSLELKDFVPMLVDGNDCFESFESLTKRANTWLKEIANLVHVGFQSVLVQKGDGKWLYRRLTDDKFPKLLLNVCEGALEEMGQSCRYSVPGANSSELMEVFRILRVSALTSGSNDRQLLPDPTAFSPFVYDMFTPEVIRRRESTSNVSSSDRMETMRDTFSKVMAYLKNTGADVICVETVTNPIPVNWSVDDDSDSKESPDVVPFLLSIRMFLVGQSVSRQLRPGAICRRGSTNPGGVAIDGFEGMIGESDGGGTSGAGRNEPLFLGSVVSRRFKYRWLVLALVGFSGMTLIVALSVVYSNKGTN